MTTSIAKTSVDWKLRWLASSIDPKPGTVVSISTSSVTTIPTGAATRNANGDARNERRQDDASDARTARQAEHPRRVQPGPWDSPHGGCGVEQDGPDRGEDDRADLECQADADDQYRHGHDRRWRDAHEEGEGRGSRPVQESEAPDEGTE
jgi:hypothetical protein